VKETMYQTIFKTTDELEQWRENSSTVDTLTSLTQIETSLDKIRKMDTAIQQDEKKAAEVTVSPLLTEVTVSSLLNLLPKKDFWKQNKHQ